MSGESYVTAKLQDECKMGEAGDIVLKEKLVTRGNAAGSEGSVELMKKFMEHVSAAEMKRCKTVLDDGSGPADACAISKKPTEGRKR